MEKGKMTYITLTDTTFRQEVLKSKQPVLVEFFAEWSGAHHIMAPGLVEMDERYRSHVRFCRIDVDGHKEVAEKYGVQNVPTILLFKDGQVVDQIVGVVPRTLVAQKLDALLGLRTLSVDC